jgi:GTP cyclohydrolase I
MNDVVKMKPARALERAAGPNDEQAEAALGTPIAGAGDDPDREGLAGAPRRVARAHEELFSGHDDPNEQTRFFNLSRGAR